MQLPGNLGSTTLGDLLGALHRSGLTGTLELVEDRGTFAGRPHRVHFAKGLVQRVETDLPVARLGDILLSEGFITRALLDRVVAKARGWQRSKLGEVLVRERVVTQDALSAALRYQLRRRLDSLFALKSALVRFRVPRPTAEQASIPLSPREFLHGRPRRRAAAGRAKPTNSGQAEARRIRALKLLGLVEGASPEAIRRAFRLEARRHHPDSHPNASPVERQELLRRFAELSAAYHQLLG